MSPWILVAVAFVSSGATAIVGIGGGTLLVAVMPGLLPTAAIVPVHGVVQLASNASRAFFARRYIAWGPVLPFALGALVGAVSGSQVVIELPEHWLPVLLGIFILVVTWLPLKKLRLPGRFATIGAVQTFVSLFVGAAGPLVSPLLLREGYDHHRVVATHGTLMTLLHALKALTFALLGFSYARWGLLLVALVAAVTAGSWVGNRLRHRLPQKPLRRGFRWLLTALALRLLLPPLAALVF